MNGKTPNPTEVILTAQSWTCRFKEAFETKKNHDRPNKGIQFNHQNIGGCWDLIIKIARARKARPKRTSFAYEASSLQRRIMCYKTLFVPRVILGLVCNTTKFALKVLGPCCRVPPTFV